MSQRSKHEYFHVIYERHHQSSKDYKASLLDEVCRVCHWHRKHAIRKLKQPLREARPRRRPKRGLTYSTQTLAILTAVWEAAGYPWSLRLKALLPLWMPWIKQHFRVSVAIEHQLLGISPRQIDRRLQGHKRKLRKRIYGRTKPGTLLKHQILKRPAVRNGWSLYLLADEPLRQHDGRIILLFYAWVNSGRLQSVDDTSNRSTSALSSRSLIRLMIFKSTQTP